MLRLRLGRVDHFDIVLIGTVLVLGVATVAILVFPAIQTRVVSPALDLSFDTVAVVVTSLLTVLSWIRYCERREPFALFESAAFLVLAVANMHAVLGTIGLDLRAPLLAIEPEQHELYVFTIARIMAAALLVIGGVSSLHGWNASHPRLIVLAPAVVMIGAVIWLTTATIVLLAVALLWPLAFISYFPDTVRGLINTSDELPIDQPGKDSQVASPNPAPDRTSDASR